MLSSHYNALNASCLMPHASSSCLILMPKPTPALTTKTGLKPQSTHLNASATR